MIRGTLAVLSFISVVFLPWVVTALLALVASIFDPLVPLAIGLFADTLYYSPQVGMIPLFTLFGALVTVVAFFVRSRLSPGIIK